MIRSHVLICGGTGCTSSGSIKVAEKLEAELTEKSGEDAEKLKELLADKDKEIEVLKTGQKEWEVKYTNLKTARTISLYDKDIKEAKQRLTGLVREVDKCIALLNE